MPDPPEPTTRDGVVQTDSTTCDIRCLETCNARDVEQLIHTNAYTVTDDDIHVYFMECFS